MLKRVYDYYKSKFNRDSLDDEGMQIKSTVHLKRITIMLFGMGTNCLWRW
ncbi:hypothetical protein P7H14_00765 [Paenibacillus larvae]|nr:hypothetical protein [Paenibacillus larvae]